MYNYGEVTDGCRKPITEWKIHQSYNEPMSEEVQEIYCTTCGGDKFEVMIDNYFTGIRCPNCGWETCIHEG